MERLVCLRFDQLQWGSVQPRGTRIAATDRSSGLDKNVAESAVRYIHKVVEVIALGVTCRLMWHLDKSGGRNADHDCERLSGP